MIGSEDCPGVLGLPEVIGAEAEEASHLVCVKHLRLDLFPCCTSLQRLFAKQLQHFLCLDLVGPGLTR